MKNLHLFMIYRKSEAGGMAQYEGSFESVDEIKEHVDKQPECDQYQIATTTDDGLKLLWSGYYHDLKNLEKV